MSPIFLSIHLFSLTIHTIFYVESGINAVIFYNYNFNDLHFNPNFFSIRTFTCNTLLTQTAILTLHQLLESLTKQTFNIEEGKYPE